MEKQYLDYPSPKPFLETARYHQRSWIINYLGVESTHNKRVLIPEDKAYEGFNFFNDQVINSVKDRFPKSFLPGKNGKPKPIIQDALRSEHIPFNLFSPLERQIRFGGSTSFFSTLTQTKLTSIEAIKIEYAASNAQKILNDRTKFDAYVTARTQNRKIVFCIEVKYTEGPYRWGKTERRRMFNLEDEYIQKTKKSPHFKPEAYKNLRNTHLKQIWRNYLLGIITSIKNNCNFIYIHLYPEGNKYQATACKVFQQNLTNIGRSNFKAITFESFIEKAKKSLNMKSLSTWISYIEDRYIVNAI